MMGIFLEFQKKIKSHTSEREHRHLADNFITHAYGHLLYDYELYQVHLC